MRTCSAGGFPYAALFLQKNPPSQLEKYFWTRAAFVKGCQVPFMSVCSSAGSVSSSTSMISTTGWNCWQCWVLWKAWSSCGHCLTLEVCSKPVVDAQIALQAAPVSNTFLMGVTCQLKESVHGSVRLSEQGQLHGNLVSCLEHVWTLFVQGWLNFASAFTPFWAKTTWSGELGLSREALLHIGNEQGPVTWNAAVLGTQLLHRETAH